MKSHIVRDSRIAHCTEINGIKVFQYFYAIIRHHPSMPEIIFTPPGKIFELKLKIFKDFRKGLETFDPF